MTLWARKSGFRVNAGENWTVSVSETPEESVVFTLTPDDSVALDILGPGGYGVETELFSYIGSVGATRADMVFESESPRIEVEVPKSRLPEDYMD